MSSHDEDADQKDSRQIRYPGIFDFIAPFPNVKKLWIAFIPFSDGRNFDLTHLQQAADECDRRRHIPAEPATPVFPQIRFLSLEFLRVEENSWDRAQDGLKLGQLKSVMKQLNLQNLRIWHLGLAEMFSFHSTEREEGGEGEDSWDLLQGALQCAQFPQLREFHLNIQFEIMNLSFDIDLCVSTTSVHPHLFKTHGSPTTICSLDWFRVLSSPYWLPVASVASYAS
jgi:hypothetical protein